VIGLMVRGGYEVSIHHQLLLLVILQPAVGLHRTDCKHQQGRNLVFSSRVGLGAPALVSIFILPALMSPLP
jgi:hypothetical protein